MADLSSYADLDLDRARRRGYPEAVYCAGKTPAQVAGIAAAIAGRTGDVTLFTRAAPAHAAAVLGVLPSAFHDPESGLLAWPPAVPPAEGGRVVVLAAGTSDLPFAREALFTARYLGREASLTADVGVAGLHRVLARLEELRAARAIVVAAGMDGALPSVVAGLVSAPVVALPTSVGYGAAFEGLAALLAMLNACAPGVAVVNIDNGYGAGHLAAQIAAPPVSRHAWIDASAGVAGDMLLGALLDAGARLDAVRGAIDEVLPGSVALSVTQVTRAGLRALKVDVDPLVAAPPHRTWRDVRPLLAGHDDALAVFGRLAGAEARVHGTEADEVHFHEVGALDSIADVVGVCAALRDLGVTSVSAGEVALGSGRVRTAHGELPVPAPAVLELARGWRVSGGGGHELATPTGLAVIRALAARCEDLPPMTVDSVGVGAGGRDTPGRANVVRVVIGAPDPAAPGAGAAVVLEANVDDLDPRLWPGVLAGLLSAGADDAWLVPILMKKGRPAHTLTVLCGPDRAAALRARIFRDTSTLGVREGRRSKTALPRTSREVALAGGTVAIKIGYADGVIVQATPEFEDVAALARRTGRPEHAVLQEALAAAAAAGLAPGSAAPKD